MPGWLASNVLHRNHLLLILVSVRKSLPVHRKHAFPVDYSDRAQLNFVIGSLFILRVPSDSIETSAPRACGRRGLGQSAGLFLARMA